MPVEGNGARVLDVGCHDGKMGALLASRGYRVTCVDRKRPRPLPESIEFLEADLNHGLPGLSGQFDWIICADILEHLITPGAILEQVRQLLKPEGALLASLPNSGNWFVRLNVLAGRFPEHDTGLFDRTHLHFYMWANWRELLVRSGFRVGRVTPTSIPFRIYMADSLAAPLERVYYGVGNIWKTLFAYQFVVSAHVR